MHKKNRRYIFPREEKILFGGRAFIPEDSNCQMAKRIPNKMFLFFALCKIVSFYI